MESGIAALVDRAAAACSSGDTAELRTTLEALKTTVVVTSTGASIGPGLAFGTLSPAGDAMGQALLAGGPDKALPVLALLAGDETPEVRCIACRAVGWIGTSYPDAVAATAYTLAADVSWEVREFIANALDDPMCREQGAYVYNLMSIWVHDVDENVRRAPTNALMRFGRQHPDHVIRLMGELIHDDSAYVRANVVFCLGVMGAVKVQALGGAAIPDRPGLLLRYLWEWAEDEDQRARWIVAKTLGRSWTKACAADALALLRRVATDGRRPVRLAVLSSLKALSKASPSETAAALAEWQHDESEAVRAVARQAAPA
jgi:HEAT repeat protein